MFGRNKFSNLPSPEDVTTYDPDLKNFMNQVHGKHGDDLQAAISGLRGEDKRNAGHALDILTGSVSPDATPITNELDEGRLLMVRDIHSLLTSGKLTEVPEMA